MSIIDQFFSTGNDLDLSTLEDESLRPVEGSTERWTQGRGPSFLPRLDGDRLSWYGLMDDAPQRRELEALLQHWVGPSCSDVHDRRGALDVDDPFDAWLLSDIPGRVLRLDVVPREGSVDSDRATVRRRLTKLVEILDQRPPHEGRAGGSLAAALDDVYLAAADGDADGALEKVRALERRQMLDAPNTAFVRLRVLATSREDERLLASQDLRDLSGQRLPRGLADAISEAVSRLVAAGLVEPNTLEAHVASMVGRIVGRAGADETADRDGPVAILLPADSPRLVDDAQPTSPHEPGQGSTESVESGPVEEGATEGSVVPPATEALRPQIVDEEASLSRLDGGQAMAMWRGGRHDELLAALDDDEECPHDVWDFALFSADALGTKAAAESVLSGIERQLGPLDSIDWVMPGAAQSMASLRVLRDGRVASWVEWFDLASSDRMPDHSVLEHAMDWDPLPSVDVVSRVSSIGEDALGRILGSFLAAHYDELDDASRGRVAAPMIEALALSGRSGRDSRAWTMALVGDALDADLDAAGRTRVLDAAEMIISQHATGSTIPWLTDLVGEVVDAWSGLAASEVERLVLSSIDALRQVRSSITRNDVRTLELAVGASTIDVPVDLHAHLVEVPEEGEPLACYAGKKVLIYSLRERSARQAAARLNQVAGVEVTLSHAHAGSARLAGQVSGADVVVIVTSAAKHSATGFIQQCAAREPLLCNSAGASGLIATLAEACD
jgi:hypothetical protein